MLIAAIPVHFPRVTRAIALMQAADLFSCLSFAVAQKPQHIPLPFLPAEWELKESHLVCRTTEADMSGNASGKGLGEIWREVSHSPPAKSSANSVLAQKNSPVSVRILRCQMNAVAKLTDLRQVSTSVMFLYFSNNDEFSNCVYVYLWASLCMCVYICIMYTNI